MAIRLERSGGLMFIRGQADEPEKPKKNYHVGLWVMLIVLVMGALFAGPNVPGWTLVSHTVKTVVSAVW